MKLFRNPRYAPEILERRLNPAPAGFFVAPVSPPVVATVAPVAPDDAVVSPAVDYSLAIADPESFTRSRVDSQKVAVARGSR
jgi:hypothetical protein